MFSVVAGQLQAEISFHRRTDVRWPSSVNTPTAVFVLMSNDPVCGPLESLGIARPQQGVQQNVIRFKSGIGFEFAAPIAILVLRREKKLARGADRGSNTTP